MPAFYRPKRDGQRGGGHRHPGGEADRGSASIGVIDAPYNFVPLSPHVFLPEWGLRVSHDIPFSDGLSGELYYTVQAETPLLVGGRQERANRDTPGAVWPFVLPDGRQAIPGSSLKGLFRSVVEIAAFGRLSKLDDVRPALRDISSSSGPYFQAVRGKVRTGFLRRTPDGGNQIIPCLMTRLDHRDLESALGLGEDETIFQARMSVRDKYRRWHQLCRGRGCVPGSIRFDLDGLKAGALFKGRTEGIPVFTGQISDSRKPGGKHLDFIFYDLRLDQIIDVPAAVWRDFLRVHGDEEASPEMSWPGHWKRHYREGGDVPVFYLPPSGASPLRIGLAFMPKLAGDFSTHEMVSNVSPSHLLPPGRAHGYDMADLLFGAINGEVQADALRGRVNCEMAIATHRLEVERQPDTILNSPKPSYFPSYVTQAADPHRWSLRPERTYATYIRSDDNQAPTLRGFKRYPVRPATTVQVQRPTAEQEKNKKVQIVLRTLPAGSRFNGRIVFHNLRPVELGALLWAMTWGGNSSLLHSIGMGKPFGLGQIRFELDGGRCRLIPNDPNEPEGALTPDRLAGLIAGFEDQMSSAIPDWKSSPQMMNLLAMADVARATKLPVGMNLRHMKMESRNNPFQKAKQSRLVLADYAVASGAIPALAHRAVAINPTPTSGGLAISSAGSTQGVVSSQVSVAAREVERDGVKVSWDKSRQVLVVVFKDGNPVRKATAIGGDALKIVQGMPEVQRTRLQKYGELAGVAVTIRLLGNQGTIVRVNPSPHVGGTNAS